MVEETVIIGAGPAGISAAIQLIRHGFSPLVLEAGGPGGLLRSANLVENYPGFPDGIPGPELADRLIAQAVLAGIKIVKNKVTALQWENGLFRIRTNKRTLFSRTVIVASGTTPKKLPGIRPRGLAKERVIYEIGPLLNIDGKHVAIVGGGDAAFDYALNLSKKNSVAILNRSDMTKCLPLLKERAAHVAAITCLSNASIRAISGTQDGRLMVNGLHLSLIHI